MEAARAQFTITAEDLSGEIATISAVQELARQTVVAVEHLQSGLTTLEGTAAANHVTLHDDGSVSYATVDMEPDEIEHLKRVAEQIETAARALITQAEEIDSDATTILTKAAAGEITAGDARTPADIKKVGREQGSLTTDPPAADLTPLQAGKYWDALSPEQKGFVLSRHPAWVGNVDGMPTGATFTNEDAELWYVEQKLKDLDAIENSLSQVNPNTSQPRDLKLMLLDMTSGERGHAAVAVGDPDTADHVSVTTPGLGTTATEAWTE